MPRCGVLGWPVRHSRSPAMHEAAYAALGLGDWSYQLLPVPPELFGETVRALPEAGLLGANVTIPHKEAALALADDATERARAIGAANTLTFADGRIHADNTDAPGLIAALPDDVSGATVFLLGAGGTARAAAWALNRAGAHVTVWNRTFSRASRLAEEIDGVTASEHPIRADILINTTSVGLHGEDDPFQHLPLPGRNAISTFGVVVDFVYGEHPTKLLDTAREQGCKVVDGLEILVRQGALSFERWTGRPAPLDAMRAAARGDA